METFKYNIRAFNGKIIGLVLRVLKSDFRFSKAHRQNETIIYMMIDTVEANCTAGMNPSF